MAKFAEMELAIQQLQQQNMKAHNTMSGLHGLVTGGFVTVDNNGNVEPVLEESQRLQIQMNHQQANSSLEAMNNVLNRVDNGGHGLQFNDTSRQLSPSFPQAPPT